MNNVAGIGGELIAASEAPDVVAVGRRFTSVPAASAQHHSYLLLSTLTERANLL